MQNTETIVRLDQSDAKYVDVVHSDMAYFVNGGFGLKQKIGHVDFFPNGGSQQPGCEKNVSLSGVEGVDTGGEENFENYRESLTSNYKKHFQLKFFFQLL